MEKCRGSPRFIMLGSILVLAAFAVLPTAASTFSTNGIALMTESRVSTPSIYYVDSTADTPLSIAIPFADVAADNHPTDEVEVLDVGKVDFVGAMTSWPGLEGSTVSSPASALASTTSTGMTGTPVDSGRLSRGVGEIEGAASLATRTQFG